MKKRIKSLAKNILPPFFYDTIRQLINKSKTFHPIWNTLDYDPLKNLKIFFDPTGSWQRKMIDGSYDAFLFKITKDLDTKDKIIFDIGAHIGYHSIYFSKLVGKNGRIFSFEPHPKNIERFKLILEKNKNELANISVYNFAISDRVGIEEFNLNEDVESGRSSGNFIDRADTFWDRNVYLKKGFHKKAVKTFSIDSFKDNLGINVLPDIIKIDVEGAEYLVLLGAKRTLLEKKPLLFIEIHSILNMYNVVTFLSSFSYKIKIINTEPNGVCFIKAEPIKEHK